MQNVREVQRHSSPAGRPQPIAFHHGTLWIGAWDTGKLYAIDPRQWAVTEEVAAPGTPYGMASSGDSLFVVVALEDDNRYLYRFTPGSGFDPSSKAACPDFTGSHLAADGATLYLCQQHNRQIVVIDDKAHVERTIALPTRCGGLAFQDSSCFIISADAEFEHLELAKLDVRQSAPAAEPIADIPFDARGLTHDGQDWWSNERDASEIVEFALS